MLINVDAASVSNILKLLPDRSNLDVLAMDGKLLKLSHSVPAPCIANLVNLSVANENSHQNLT